MQQTKPFGVEYLEPMAQDETELLAVHGGVVCVTTDTYHAASGTSSKDLVCDD